MQGICATALPIALVAFALAFLPLRELRAQEDVSGELARIRNLHRLPGLAAMVLKDGAIVARGASGARRTGSLPPLLVSDRISIASCTKWMTATLAGRLVDRGAIAWETRVRDCFPNFATFHPALREVTLDQLLCHRAGIQESETFEKKDLGIIGAKFGPIPWLRRRVSEAVLRDPPAVAIGDYLYANQGYAVAASMMELKTGKSWETLMQEQIFAPLGMATADFGQACDDELPPRAPVGHRLPELAKEAIPKPAIPGSILRQLQASFGPGGFVICTLGDWGKFLYAHTQPAGFLSPATSERLHSPFAGRQGYGRGVNIVERPWATPGPAFTHSGDIFGQDTVFWISPSRHLVVMAYTNCRSVSNDSVQALDEAASYLVSRYAGEK